MVCDTGLNIKAGILYTYGHNEIVIMEKERSCAGEMDEELKKLEEEFSDNRPTFSLTELLKCMALIVAGCVIFVIMPADMGIGGWILFTLGTFLNIVGIFRLAATVPEVKSDKARKIAMIISLVAAVLIQVGGLAYLYGNHGTGKAMAITTLTLCVSLGLIYYVVDFDDKKMKKKIVMACRIITVILVAIAILLNISSDFTRASIYVGTILVIEALITGRIGMSKLKRKH